MSYKESYRNSIENPEAFWKEQAEAIAWYKFPQNILTKDDEGLTRWFSDGELNTAYLALDYHIEQGRGDQAALIYDSPVTNTKRTYSYNQLRDDVAKFSGVLRELGIEKSDRVVIYMPMIPEAVIAMLACARLGAIHSVVFGGFAPHELAVRIDDSHPKLLVTASYGIEIDHRIEYKPLVDEALDLANHKIEKVVLFQRQDPKDSIKSGRDFLWQDLVTDAVPVAPVPVQATDPLYILYTSGTTGVPKGVVRDNGGHAVALKYSMSAIYNVQPDSVYWAASDIGWVVGHSYIVYAPLIHGCTTILYEGKPVRTPDPGAFWRVISDHKVHTLFTAPTAFRAIKKEDPEGKFKNDYDLSNFKTLFLAGERLDPPTLEWLDDLLKIPVIDHWWQTETGWPIVSNPIGIESFPIKSGSSTYPVPGYEVVVLDDSGQPVPTGTTGNITIKLPLPPGCLPNLWQNIEHFRKSYLATYPGYYVTADEGFIDEDGYVFIMGRTDDIINVAGHRLSTGEMEEILGSHPAIAECAVVGMDDEIKGQVPVGFIVLKDGVETSNSVIEQEAVALIRKEIGAVASFRKAAVVQRLPKTRSGKILRKSIRLLAKQKEVPIPPTIDDPIILSEIREVLEQQGIAKES